MADWADEKANTLRIDLVESPANTAYFLEQVSQALREAEARGVEKAKEVVECLEHALALDYFNPGGSTEGRAKQAIAAYRKHAGTERQPKERG